MFDITLSLIDSETKQHFSPDKEICSTITEQINSLDIASMFMFKEETCLYIIEIDGVKYSKPIKLRTGTIFEFLLEEFNNKIQLYRLKQLDNL